MKLKLEVLLSASINHKIPWPRLHWIGQEKEAILLYDDQRLSLLTLSTGRTQKKIPKLQPLLKNVLSVVTSANGIWLAGILTTGELFLWKKDGDCLKMVGAVEGVCMLAAAAQESTLELFLFVTNNGKRVLLLSQTGTAFLWQSSEQQDLPSVPGPRISGRWAQILPDERIRLPQSEDKESAVHAVFIADEMLGNCCLCSFAFISRDAVVLTTLEVKWFEQVDCCISAVPFSVQWTTQTHVLGGLIPACQPVKSRGALLIAFSPDGLVLAVIINQNDPKATQVLFVNPRNPVTVSSSLQGCGSRECPVPVRFIRSYWVGGVSWTQDGLFLACVLRRGALLLLSRLGELVTITTSGCCVEFGPAEFIPLHPLISYRQPLDADPMQSAGSSTGESDPTRQRFSLATHPRSPYLIVSDGYMFTVLRFAEHISATSALKSLLLEATQGLEDVQNLLFSSEEAELKWRVPHMTSLRRNILQGWGTQEPGTWTPPAFLTDQKSEGNEADEGDEWEGEPAGSASCLGADSMLDQGCLEFASAVDTLHAKQGEQANSVEAQFRRIQNSLLMSWSMGISLKEMDGRDLLLQHTVKALLQYARLLPFAPATLASSLAKLKGKMVHKALRRCPGLYRTLQLLRYCLLVLHWDAAHKHALTHVVSLVSGFVNLILSRKLGAASISQSLLSSLLVLRLSSVHLNAVYSLQKEAYPDLPRNLAFASFQAPVTQPADPGVKYHKLALLELPTQTVPTVQEPSQRLAFIWRLLYQQVLQHHSHLRKLQRHSGRGGTRKKLQREVDLLTSVLSQTQAALQAMGERLGERRQLKPLLGEEYFLLGSYLESVQTWKTALQGEVGGEERRLIYLQTRYCLAILYTHLYLSNLSAALDFCEQLVRQMFRPEQTNNSPGPSVLSLDVSLMPSVGEVAAVAVVQSLARFMALYFTNQPLFVLPPHHVDVLPPLHFRPGSLPRVVPLQQSRVAAAVREQNLCTGWSVERALDLMLLGRLIPEAAWMARTLGDWKTAVVLGLAFNLYSEGVPQAARSRWRSLHLPKELHPSQIFQEKLQALLGHAPMSDMPLPGCAVNSTAAPGHNRKLLTDSIEEEDADLMFDSVQEILKAAVMADADVLTQTFDLLMQSAKDLAMGLSGLVPEGLYLPAPPLYCPQPALISEGGGEDLGLSRERGARQKLSGLLQRFLLLFRAARCSLPAAHWYIRKLQHSRKIMNKIRRKSGMEPLCPFPNSLLQYSKAESSFFPPGARGDGTHGAISAKLVGSFRDLCGLCWMFHVREQLSERCRKYQAARESARSPQDCELAAEYDATVVDHCLASLEWACRMLPFARFMNVEELVQDVILSLVNELPPIRKVAEVVVRAFPDLEDVRVPLRDKHHSLQQRLRHSAMQGPDGEEMMTIVLHEVYRHRMKMLKRAGRNIGPTERHIWERADEGLREQEDEVHDQFSLGTSGSRSTLTDTRRSQDQSEGDTMDNMSMEIQELNEQQSCPQQQADISYREIQPSHHRTSRPQGPVCRKAAAESVAGEVEGHLPQLPLVGSWEFEREDEEYVNFLELFLSYLLERDQMVNESPSVPLLTSCSSFLREQELNSLAFHVQSTLKRRQSRVRVAEDTFLAKSTVTSVPDLHQHETSRMSPREEQMRAAIFSPIPATLHSPSHSHVPSAEGNVYGCFPAGIQHRDRARGLFGLKLQSLIGPSSTPWQLGPLPSSRPVIAPAPCTECLSVPALLNDDLAPEVEARFQGTAKLLEWMIRWSERRLRCGQHKVESLEARGATIRVKTSVTAILRSLELLGRSLGINMSHPNNKDDEEGFAVDHGRTRKSSDSSFFKASVAGSETHPEPFQQWDQEEDVQKQDRGDAQELTSDSDSGTDEDESGNSQRLHPQEDGGGIAPSGVYMEEETRPCTPISPSISISIKPKPRARIRDTMASGLETDAPISMDPGEQAGTAICRDPGECISKNSAKQSNEPTSTDHSETMDKSTDTDHREWMDKPTGTDRREMMDKPTGTDRREWMDKPTSTDRREMMDKPTGTDRREWMDKPTSTDRREMMDKPTDRREWMDKPTGTDRREWMDKPTGTDRREWMDKPTSTDRREMVDKPTGTDRREWMDKPTGTDRREMVDKPTGTDQREWMDKPTGTDRREMVDKPTGTDRREWMDKPTGTDCSETMDKHVQVDSAQRQNIQQFASLASLPSLVYSSMEQAVAICQPMSQHPSMPATDTCAAMPTDGQAANTSDVVRHVLQDEMFKLLQLQQINYLSLVQVVGSSLRDTLAPPTPTPSRNAPPAGHIASLGQQEDKRAPVENGLLQQKPSLSEEKVAKSPEDHPVHVGPEDAGVCGPWRLSKTSIVPQPQLLRGSGTSRQEVPGTCPTPGLPLLRLQPQRELQAVPVGGSKLPYPAPLLRPRVREAWAPQLTDRPRPSFPTYPNTPAPYQVTEDRDGWLSRGSPTLLKMVQYQQLPAPCSSQPPGKAAGSQPPALHGNPPPLVGLPLLRLPQPTQTTLLPLYSRPPPAEPRKLPAASTHYPNLQQQLTSFCPESQVSMFHPPRLIPAHDLVAFEQGRLRRAQQSPGRPQAEAFHLLKVNLQPFEPRTQHNGKKRVKRRERRRAEKSVCKVPSSEQSLKTPDQPVPQPVPQPEGRHLPEDVSVTPKPDPWDGGTALAGSTLLPEWDSGSCLFATAAELHYLASTRKHTEERRDASTNTDQSTEPQPPTAPKSYRDAGILACSEIEDGDHPPTSAAAAPKSYRDAGILACSEIEDEDHPPTSAAAVEPPPVDDPQVQVLPPDVLVNLRFPTEVYQESLSTPANPEAPDQELSGHEFLNVVDIDASDVLNDLPATTAVMDKMPTLKDEAMSIPALHLMSASLTNIVPPDTSPPHESPAAASVRFSCEDWGQQLAGDELTQRLLQKASAPVQAPPQEPVRANHQVRAQLSEMEQQLNALQDIAVNMEQDFANTKLLINTIEHLGCAIDLQGPGGCFVSLPVPGHAQPCDRADEKAMDRVYHAGEGSDPPSPPPVPSEKAAEGGWGPQVTAGWCECLGSGSPSPAHGTAKTRGSPRVLAAAAIPVSGRGVSSCPLMPQPGRSQEEPKQSHHQNLQIGAAPRRLQHHTPTRAPAEDLILPAETHAFQMKQQSMHTSSNPADSSVLSTLDKPGRFKAPIRMSRRKDSSSSLEDWLGWSGLSGVSDIISDLITEGKLSAEALGLTEGQARHLSRSSKLPKKSEQKRKEVQEWMKCKRQQRLEAYLGHREELKERERRPYLPKDKRKAFTSREIKENQKKKAMRKRVTLAEHHEQRAQAALTLMSEMLCDTVQLPTSVVRARGDKPVKSAQHRRSGSGSTPRGRSPASRSLSAGRASWSLSDTFTMGGARSSPPSPGKAVQLVCQPLHTAADDLDDTDSLSRWSPPEYIRHILARDTEPLLQEADVEDPHPGARADQDVQSDTIDDVLCELDWNSVNCMVASRNQK